MTRTVLSAVSVNLSQLQNSVEDWHRRVFTEKSLHLKAMKLGEEVGEVLGALVKMAEGRKTLQDVRDEMGDVVITLCALASDLGIDLGATVEDRWTVVQTRTYKEE